MNMSDQHASGERGHDGAAAPAPPRRLSQGRYLRLLAGQGWEWVERTTARRAAVIVAATPEGKLLFVEQFRIPLGRPVLEFPAGMIGDTAGSEGETVLAGARRELREETGYDAADVRLLAECPTSPGLTSETVCFVLAEGLRRVSAGGGIDHERITVHEVPLAECDAWLHAQTAGGQTISATVYAGLCLLRSQRPA